MVLVTTYKIEMERVEMTPSRFLQPEIVKLQSRRAQGGEVARLVILTFQTQANMFVNQGSASKARTTVDDS